MPLGIHRRIVLRDAALGVDDEGLAAGIVGTMARRRNAARREKTRRME
jgi:hypothetical protein